LYGSQPEWSCQTNFPVLAATPLLADTTRRQIVRKSPHVGHKVFAFHAALCTLHSVLFGTSPHPPKQPQPSAHFFGNPPERPKNMQPFYPLFLDHFQHWIVNLFWKRAAGNDQRTIFPCLLQYPQIASKNAANRRGYCTQPPNPPQNKKGHSTFDVLFALYFRVFCEDTYAHKQTFCSAFSALVFLGSQAALAPGGIIPFLCALGVLAVNQNPLR
ncbi:MAG: hypothetical protein K8I30_06525, partial [Anaerolineae bacterium]|nr:hypothetical protein [Anaerolineae bacterium]